MPLTEQDILEEARRRGLIGGPSPQTPFSGVGEAAAEDDDFFSNLGRDVLRSIADRPLETVGGGLGAVAGSVAGPVGTVAGGVAGAGLGALGDVALQQSGIVPAFDPPQTPQQAAARVPQAGGAELVGQGVAGALARGAAPFAKSVTPEGKEALETIMDVENISPIPIFGKSGTGQVIAPDLVTENFFTDIAATASRLSPIGGNRPVIAQKKAAEFVDQEINNFIGRYKNITSNEALGVDLQQAIKDKDSLFFGYHKGKFLQLTSKTGGRPVVDMRGALGAAELIARRGEETIKTPGMTDIINQVLTKPGKVDFRTAQLLRSKLLKIGRKSDELIPDDVVQGVKKISKAIDGAMAKAAKENGLLKEWRIANASWAKGAEVFSNRVITKMIKQTTDPSEVFDIGIKNASPEQIRRVRAAVGDIRLWNEVKGHHLSEVAIASKDVSGDIRPKQFINMFNKLGKSDRAAWKEIYTHKDINTIKRLSNAKLTLFETPNAKFKLGFGIAQSAAAGALFLGLPEGVKNLSAGVIIGPAAIALAFTNPRFVKWVTTGYRVPRTVSEAARITARTMAILTRENIPFEVESPETAAQTPFSGLAQQFAGAQ